MRRGATLALLVLVSAGCGPELGACDVNEARRIVYDGSGAPAFEGQALMIQSCGFGAFCHSPGIDTDDRFGVPVGLDYDLRLASFGVETQLEETERLRAMQARTFADRHAIWEQVLAERMPISGAAGADALEGAPQYSRIHPVTRAPSPAPNIYTEEGREILRNWLACGVPVVERTMAPTDDVEVAVVGHIVSTAELVPLEADWGDIYARLIETRCNAGACHGASAAGGLDLRGQDEALATLLAGSAQDEDDCGAAVDTPYIVPGEPESSLLYQKLTGVVVIGDAVEPVCGRRMPTGGSPVSEASLANIAAWIAALPM